MNQRKASFLPAHTEKQVSSLTPSSKSSYRRRHPWKEIIPAVKGQKWPKWTGLWSEYLKYLWTQRKNTEKIKLKKNQEFWFICWFHYKIEAPALTLGPIWTPNQTSGWGKQGLHVLDLLAVSSMLAHFSKMNQNTVHSLFYSHHTSLPFYLQINCSI